jgi:hypothetical protein
MTSARRHIHLSFTSDPLFIDDLEELKELVSCFYDFFMEATQNVQFIINFEVLSVFHHAIDPAEVVLAES